MQQALTLKKKVRELIVDYRTPLDAQIRCLFPDWLTRHKAILEAFDATQLKHERLGRERVRFELRQSKTPITTQTVQEDFQKHGYEAGNLTELLAFRRTFPRVQYTFKVIGLGTRICDRGTEKIPYLWHGDSGLCLSLEQGYKMGAWDPRSVFLAVASREKL